MSATTVGKAQHNLIGGESVPAADGATSTVLDPATEQPIAEVPRSSSEDVDRAVAVAREAFESWSLSTPVARSEALRKLADLIEEDASEFMRIESQDAGHPIAAVRDEEFPMVVDHLRFFSSAARCLEGKAAGEYLEDHTSMTRREAIGVVGSIPPWNYPLMMAIWKMAPAIAGGNTVVLKPASATPLSTLRLAELAAEVLPPGVLNVVVGPADPVGQALVRHPDVDMISLTGSAETGKWIAREASATLKRLHLELGGKAPVVVFEDADLDEGLEIIAGTGYFNAGQDCTAACRVLVHESRYDEVVNGLVAEAKGLILGDTTDEGTTLGPLVSEAHRRSVKGFLDRCPKHAEIVTGGTVPDRPGYFLEPTVVAGLRQADEMIREEIFGPVITVQSFKDEAEAVQMSNDTPYGLASSVWTQDLSRALRVSRALRFGCVWINNHIPVVAEMPHGGFKQSGYGKDLSAYALDDYTEVKHVMAKL